MKCRGCEREAPEHEALVLECTGEWTCRECLPARVCEGVRRLLDLCAQCVRFMEVEPVMKPGGAALCHAELRDQLVWVWDVIAKGLLPQLESELAVVVLATQNTRSVARLKESINAVFFRVTPYPARVLSHGLLAVDRALAAIR